MVKRKQVELTKGRGAAAFDASMPVQQTDTVAVNKPAGMELVEKTYYYRQEQIDWLIDQTVARKKKRRPGEECTISAIVREAIDRLREAEG